MTTLASRLQCRAETLRVALDLLVAACDRLRVVRTNLLIADEILPSYGSLCLRNKLNDLARETMKFGLALRSQIDLDEEIANVTIDA